MGNDQVHQPSTVLPMHMHAYMHSASLSLDLFTLFQLFHISSLYIKYDLHYVIMLHYIV